MTIKRGDAIVGLTAGKAVCSVIGLDIHANKVMSVELDMSADNIAAFVIRVAATSDLLSAWAKAIDGAVTGPRTLSDAHR